MRRGQRYYLLGAVLVGLLARVPGIFWGSNFPFGWYGHHPDEYTHLVNAEMLIYPGLKPRWSPHPYPKGLAAHVAVPLLLMKKLEGAKADTLPHPKRIIVAGRVVAVLYGAATVLVVFLLTRCLFRDPRVPLFAAWMTALGGLHVSQSHYFVSDVPALFWLLLALYFLARELRARDGARGGSPFLIAAAFCSGLAFGLKLTVAGLPSLGLVTLAYRPRLMRLVHAAAYALLGVVVVNFAAYTPHNVLRTFQSGVGDPNYHFSRLSSLLLYAIELPSIMSLPVVLLAGAGGIFLLKRLASPEAREHWRFYVLIVLLPAALSFLLMLKTAHFPRHVIPLFPWLFMAAAWSLASIVQRLESRGWRGAWAVAPLLAYLALFVFDGERVFLQEPRNEAARWLMANVPPGEQIYWRRHGWIEGYRHAIYPDARPTVMIMEMYNDNHYLSGLGFKNSYPRDYRFIFDGVSQEWVDAHQSLFRGTAGYEEVIRFGEGYFMPEFVITDGLLGNRSRNYVSEIVIFRKKER